MIDKHLYNHKVKKCLYFYFNIQTLCIILLIIELYSKIKNLVDTINLVQCNIHS